MTLLSILTVKSIDMLNKAYRLLKECLRGEIEITISALVWKWIFKGEFEGTKACNVFNKFVGLAKVKIQPSDLQRSCLDT